MKHPVAAWAACGIALALVSASARGEWILQPPKSAATIRPLHGVNGGPLCYRGVVDLTASHRALRIPSTRLHDVVWLNAEAVDLHVLFRDPRGDPSNPDAYDFRATDDYVAGVLATGAEVVYRLGESIEHTPRKYWVHPPADPDRWARICEGVIRHYNEGWAGGFRHGIRYWEIWNEPDVRPAMWTGTDEDYFRLYEVAARHLKTRFPHLRIGGPAVGGVGDLTPEGFRPSAFVRGFLAHCRSRGVPLDFFSWHRYTDRPRDLLALGRGVRRLLDEHGFARTESHLNEWNYLPGNDWQPMLRDGQGASRERWYAEMGGPAGAAFAASGLILLQDAAVDVANWFSGEIQGFGLFTFHGEPKKTAGAFQAFAGLLETPVRWTVESRDEPGPPGTGWEIIAGCDEKRTRMRILAGRMASGSSPLKLAWERLPWVESTQWEASVIDRLGNGQVRDRGTLPESGRSLEIALEGSGVVAVSLSPARRTP